VLFVPLWGVREGGAELASRKVGQPGLPSAPLPIRPETPRIESIGVRLVVLPFVLMSHTSKDHPGSFD
jgi:hypothetical protein